ncbi:MAG: c-type cytochrome [Methylobacteriaceae bacterium]|nr:c-type cytochrome [Methylobacteriaceae bacterium]
MRRRWPALAGLTVLVALLAGVAAGALWRLSAPRPAMTEADAASLEGGNAVNGRRVFNAAQCASCHASTGQTDRLRLGGGYALESPFGTFRVPNISPHPADGIGSWSAVALANAILAGISPDGRHYYPVLPYPEYAHMRREDVRDLIAYLRTLPPVEGRPAGNELSFPFSIRRAVGLWKALFLDGRPIADDPTRSVDWNRGHYLVEAMGHCAECHSGRNLLYAVKANQRFAGGVDPSGTGFVPNITPGRIGRWSVGEIAEVLSSGRTPELRFVGSTMADVVANMRELPVEDRQAIATFVKELPARPTTRP